MMYDDVWLCKAWRKSSPLTPPLPPLYWCRSVPTIWKRSLATFRFVSTKAHKQIYEGNRMVGALAVNQSCPGSTKDEFLTRSLGPLVPGSLDPWAPDPLRALAVTGLHGPMGPLKPMGLLSSMCPLNPMSPLRPRLRDPGAPRPMGPLRPLRNLGDSRKNWKQLKSLWKQLSQQSTLTVLFL